MLARAGGQGNLAVDADSAVPHDELGGPGERDLVATEPLLLELELPLSVPAFEPKQVPVQLRRTAHLGIQRESVEVQRIEKLGEMDFVGVQPEIELLTFVPAQAAGAVERASQRLAGDLAQLQLPRRKARPGADAIETPLIEFSVEGFNGTEHHAALRAGLDREPGVDVAAQMPDRPGQDVPYPVQLHGGVSAAGERHGAAEIDAALEVPRQPVTVDLRVANFDSVTVEPEARIQPETQRSLQRWPGDREHGRPRRLPAWSEADSRPHRA